MDIQYDRVTHVQACPYATYEHEDMVSVRREECDQRVYLKCRVRNIVLEAILIIWEVCFGIEFPLWHEMSRGQWTHMSRGSDKGE